MSENRINVIDLHKTLREHEVLKESHCKQIPEM